MGPLLRQLTTRRKLSLRFSDKVILPPLEVGQGQNIAIRSNEEKGLKEGNGVLNLDNMNS